MKSRIIKQITAIGLVSILLGCQDNLKGNYKNNSQNLRYQDNSKSDSYLYVDMGYVYSKEMGKFYIPDREKNCWRPVPVQENRDIVIWHEDVTGDGKLDCIIDISKIQPKN